MIPKILHQTSGKRSLEEHLMALRMRRLMPDFKYIFWDDAANLELFESVFPRYVDDYLKFSRGVIRADISRCLFLFRHGGVYCDTDYRFVQPLDCDFLSNLCVLGLETESCPTVGGAGLIGNAFMASAAGFELWAEFVESIFRSVRSEDDVVELSGPQALTKFLISHDDYRKQVTILPPHVLYPNSRQDYNAETIGAHLCWGSWRDRSRIRRFKGQIMRWINVIR